MSKIKVYVYERCGGTQRRKAGKKGTRCIEFCARVHAVASRMRRLGVKEATFDKIFKLKKRNICSLCGRKRRKEKGTGDLCIDHDHKTKKIRGVICHECNVFLGFIEKYERLYPRKKNKFRKYLGLL